jgi:hypothetical protein
MGSVRVAEIVQPRLLASYLGGRSGAHPRYGARLGSPDGGHRKYSAPIPKARKASSSRLHTYGVQRHRLCAIGHGDAGGLST